MHPSSLIQTKSTKGIPNRKFQPLASHHVREGQPLMLAQVPLELDIDTPGMFNAIAFWFELQLDEATSLSTSPYTDKVFMPPGRLRIFSACTAHRLRRCCHCCLPIGSIVRPYVQGMLMNRAPPLLPSQCQRSPVWALLCPYIVKL